MLTKQQIVMHKETTSDMSFKVWFIEDDDGGALRSTQMYREDWKDMGSPDTITITIEPGDLLQKEDIQISSVGFHTSSVKEK